MVRKRVERASLWKVMMMLVEGRSGSNVTEAHLKDSKHVFVPENVPLFVPENVPEMYKSSVTFLFPPRYCSHISYTHMSYSDIFQLLIMYFYIFSFNTACLLALSLNEQLISMSIKKKALIKRLCTNIQPSLALMGYRIKLCQRYRNVHFYVLYVMWLIYVILFKD